MAKGKQRIAVDGGGGALRQPLPGLATLRDRLPATPSAGAAASEPVPDAAAEPAAAPESPAAPKTFFSRSPRLVVRREKKGHGGKTATRIEGLIGSPHELDKVAREIKRALGCGATVDRADVVVQGDLVERVRAFLAAHGARKIVLGS